MRRRQSWDSAPRLILVLDNALKKQEGEPGTVPSLRTAIFQKVIDANTFFFRASLLCDDGIARAVELRRRADAIKRT